MKVVDIRILGYSQIALEFEDGQTETINIGTGENEPELVVNQIMFEHSEIPDNMRSKLMNVVTTVMKKLEKSGIEEIKNVDSRKIGKYSRIKHLTPHILHQCSFVINSKCDIVASCGYDRKAIITDIEESCVINECEGHKNVVYCIAINKPFEDKIATGSFDKTARIWTFPSGELLHILEGHIQEVVAIDFSPSGCLLATCEMNGTCILWNVNSGEIIHKLVSHSAEVIISRFNSDSSMIVTGSFDKTCKVWDTSSGVLVGTFDGNTAEISWVGYNTNCDKCFSCSVDRYCCIWDSSNCELIQKFEDFSDEVLFGCIANVNGRELFAACSTDKTAIVYDLSTYSILFKVEGHSDGVNRILFSPRGTHFVTTSVDKTCKIWSLSTGELEQTLEGHDDEIFDIAFNEEGDKLVSGSKDQRIIIWKYNIE